MADGVGCVLRARIGEARCVMTRGAKVQMRRLGLVLAGCCVVLIAAGAPALAHDELVGSTPADGAVLTEGPTEVVLTFSEDVQDLGTAVLVREESGRDAAGGGLAIEGPVVTQKVDATAAGIYTTSYRVVSADGHPVSGELTFTVSGDDAAGADIAAVVSSPTAQEGSATDRPVWKFGAQAWLVGSVLVIVGLVFVNIRRRRRRRRSQGH